MTKIRYGDGGKRILGRMKASREENLGGETVLQQQQQQQQLAMAMDVMRWILLASYFTSTSCLSSGAGAKVGLEEVTSNPQRFCAQLKTHGFAVVRTSLLDTRAEALEWLEARHDADATLVEAEFAPGLARCADVTFPRRLRRLDLAPTSEEAAGPAISGLAAELHNIAVQCLHAIAEHEELPLDDLVAEVHESLDHAKDIAGVDWLDGSWSSQTE
eukprot:s548_g9.t3